MEEIEKSEPAKVDKPATKQNAAAAAPPKVEKPAAQQVSAAKGAAIAEGKTLIANNDCKACHTINDRLVGPSYLQVAEKYKNTPANINKLTGKIISGGAGVWGQIPMTPHPQLSKAEASKMVQYILSKK